MVWLDDAVTQLNAIFEDVNVRGLDPKRLRLVLERIELGLVNDPSSFGESRSGRTRLWFEGPLEVLYQVHEKAEVVAVERIRLLHRRY